MLKKWVFLAITLALVLSICRCGLGPEQTMPTPTTPQTAPNESSTPMPVTPEEADQDDIEWLAITIALEAGSVWDGDQWVPCSETERACVGWTILNRFNGLWEGHTYDCIRAVVAERNQYALTIEGYIPSDYDRSAAEALEYIPQNRRPTPEIRELAKKLLEGQIADPTGGATHFFSPISMPKEGESTTGFDIGKELHEVRGIPKLVYFPSWTKTYAWVGELDNVRKAYFMFYRSGAPPTPDEVSVPTFEESGWSVPANISLAASTSILTSIWSEECKEITAVNPALAVDSSDVLHAVWVKGETEKIKQASEPQEWYDLKFNKTRSLSYSFKENNVWSKPIRIFSTSEIGSWLGLLVEKPDGTHLIWTGIGDFLLVVDKNNNLHLIWYVAKSESDQTLKLETGSGPTTMSSHPLWKKLYYCQKPDGEDWSEPIMLGETEWDYDWSKPIVVGETTYYEHHYSTNLLGKTIEGGIGRYILQVDSKGVPHILVAVCATRWQGVYHLTKDENNIWANRGIDCPVERVNDKWRYSPFRWWATLDDRDTWHFIWDSYGGKVFYSTKPKGGSWQSPLEIYEGNALSSLTAILDTEGNLHFAWRGGPSKGPSPIIYAFKPKNGTLSDLVYLTEDSHDFSSYEWGIQLTLDGNNFPHITWVGDDYKIMYSAKLKDEGWSKPVVAISNDVGRVIVDSCLACDKNALHLVVSSGEYWERRDIFYSFKPLE